jgi:hypothetical protein
MKRGGKIIEDKSNKGWQRGECTFCKVQKAVTIPFNFGLYLAKKKDERNKYYL